MTAPRRSATADYSIVSYSLAGFSLILALFTVALCFAVDNYIVDQEMERRGEELKQRAALFANLIDNEVARRLTDIESRARLAVPLGLVDGRARLDTWIGELQAAMPEYSWIGYANSSGRVVGASRNMLLDASVEDRPWFRSALRGPVVIDVHDAVLLASLIPPGRDGTPQRFIDVAAPLRNSDGAVVGVMGAHISADWLHDRLVRYALTLGVKAAVNPAVVGADRALRFGALPVGLNLKGLKGFGTGTSGSMILPDAQGKEYLIGHAPGATSNDRGGLGWTTVLYIPVDRVTDDIRAARLTAISSVGAIALIALLAFFGVLRFGSRPVRHLMQRIEEARFSGGQVAVPERLPREFRRIADVLNDLLGSLAVRERSLESALHDLRQSFSGVTKSFPGVLFRLEQREDGGGYVFTYLSPSATFYLGVDGTALPMPVEHLFHRLGEEEENIALAAREAIEAGDALDLVLTVIGGDGVRRHMRMIAHPSRDADGDKSWDGVMVNVTDLVAAEQAAKAADQAKSRFLATMSHEIRTPLNGILGFARLLEEELGDPDRKRDARKIVETAETLSKILNDILDLSKIEEGKLHLETRPFKISELIESSVSLYHAEAKRRGIDFTVTATESECTLLGDPVRLRQIIHNLLSNAMKFAPDGKVALDVLMEITAEKRRRLRITVSDNGIGMTEEQVKNLFQRFQQADRSIFRRFGGSGLGLAIVRGLLEQMGGSIRVESTPGAGTRFIAEAELDCIPFVAASPAAPVAPRTAARKLNVLVVDDVPTNRDIVRRLLLKDGHAVAEADDGQKAVEVAAGACYDLILMDVDMPVMTGLEATRAIRAGGGPSCKARIVALTGFAYESDVAQARDAGMDGHLPKPISFNAVRELVADVAGTVEPT